MAVLWRINMKDFWDYIYGSKSHLNLAGKIILGIPMFPFLFLFIGTYCLLELLFSKKDKHENTNQN